MVRSYPLIYSIRIDGDGHALLQYVLAYIILSYTNSLLSLLAFLKVGLHSLWIPACSSRQRCPAFPAEGRSARLP